ncbi:MAG: histone H1 [Gammaproteobacteria bacterium]|nr:histone H1 [Gammaproteobacteria bacterium]
MTNKLPKGDINQRAKFVVDLATKQHEEEPEKVSGKVRSGNARAAGMSSTRRTEIAKIAAASRWNK